MAIDSMTITNTKQISIFHHKIFNDDKRILIDFVFLVDSQTFAIAISILRDKIYSLFFLLLAMLS